MKIKDGIITLIITILSSLVFVYAVFRLLFIGYWHILKDMI